MNIAVLCAMEREYSLFIERMKERSALDEDVVTGTIEDCADKLIVARSGIGKVNAALAANRIISKYGVGCVISVGVAGGIDKSLKVGDIVIGNSYCYHDVWCGEPNKEGQVQGLPAFFPSCFGIWMEKIGTMDVKLGTIATGDWFIQTAYHVSKNLGWLPKEYNIMAVDMESAAIAQVCYISNIPFMSIRAISDIPVDPYIQNAADHKEKYEAFWDSEAGKSFDVIANILK